MFKSSNDRKTHGEFFFDEKKWKVVMEGIHLNEDSTSSANHYIVMIFSSGLNWTWWTLRKSYPYQMDYAAKNRLEKIRLELMQKEIAEKTETN